MVDVFRADFAVSLQRRRTKTPAGTIQVRMILLVCLVHAVLARPGEEPLALRSAAQIRIIASQASADAPHQTWFANRTENGWSLWRYPESDAINSAVEIEYSSSVDYVAGCYRVQNGRWCQ